MPCGGGACAGCSSTTGRGRALLPGQPLGPECPCLREPGGEPGAAGLLSGRTGGRVDRGRAGRRMYSRLAARRASGPLWQQGFGSCFGSWCSEVRCVAGVGCRWVLLVDASGEHTAPHKIWSGRETCGTGNKVLLMAGFRGWRACRDPVTSFRLGPVQRSIMGCQHP
jgi:hypothetical protein